MLSFIFLHYPQVLILFPSCILEVCEEADPGIGNDHEGDEESYEGSPIFIPEQYVDDPKQRRRWKQNKNWNHKGELLFPHSV